MRLLERLLEVWTHLTAANRTLVVNLAEALLDRPSARPTVVMPQAEPKPKRCPDCRVVITDCSHRYCGDCGCILPTWAD